jgi:REP element-mobilizing transposase RayT
MPSKFDPKKHHRRSIRLKGYDYTQPGAYFVTIVAWQRECLFGEIVDEEMRLNEYGKIIQNWWNQIPNHFPNVETIVFVIMPNHVHGIIVITTNRRGTVPVPHIHEEKDETTSQAGGEAPPLRIPTSDRLWRISNINRQRK